VYRPHYVVIPKDKNGFAIDDQYFIGSGLLVKPIVEQGVKEIQVYLPEDEVHHKSP
jgi:alpha 1,3-glucosidase